MGKHSGHQTGQMQYMVAYTVHYYLLSELIVTARWNKYIEAINDTLWDCSIKSITKLLFTYLSYWLTKLANQHLIQFRIVVCIVCIRWNIPFLSEVSVVLIIYRAHTHSTYVVNLCEAIQAIHRWNVIKMCKYYNSISFSTVLYKLQILEW